MSGTVDFGVYLTNEFRNKHGISVRVRCLEVRGRITVFCSDWLSQQTMNNTISPTLLTRLFFRMKLGTRYLSSRPTCTSFGAKQQHDVIDRICVINLDRQIDRWRHVQRELRVLRDTTERPLLAMTRRFSAVDARYYEGPPSIKELLPRYTLAEQLFVDPNPLIPPKVCVENQPIYMTPQEVAVALSHIGVWKTIAESESCYTLVLEDDAYFRRGFARTFEKVWAELMRHARRSTPFDILYLSYEEAQAGARRRNSDSNLVFIPLGGMWQLSGYVLSKKGARKLLDLLPVRGPVDLWINHQFDEIDVFATNKPLIEQRPDSPSTNSYSILPVLSKVGILKYESPQLFKPGVLPKPVFGIGPRGSGLTALAMALSILGYRCCSDVAELPTDEQSKLLGGTNDRLFDAYVNISSFTLRDYLVLAENHPQARFVITGSHLLNVPNEEKEIPHNLGRKTPLISEHHQFMDWYGQLHKTTKNLLVLPANHNDKWELLCSFLGCDYPTAKYPECEDQLPRKTGVRHPNVINGSVPNYTRLRSDKSPWVLDVKNWHGIPLSECDLDFSSKSTGASSLFLDRALWKIRDDTFPDNLALFTKNNFSFRSESVVRLTLRKEPTSVRDFTSAAICTRQTYLYGKFVAVLKPVNVSGIITGVFLHRNSPRQEIDFEFLGRDTTKVLINVFYNPGNDGTKMEFGYRGSPALIDLGFDASMDFHRYEIEWSPNSIRWYVDGSLVCERVNWDPTPIPHLPMELNVNLWHARSVELAGKLSEEDLPVWSEVRQVEIHH